MKSIMLLIFKAGYWVPGDSLYYSLLKKKKWSCGKCYKSEKHDVLRAYNKGSPCLIKGFSEELMLELTSKEWVHAIQGEGTEWVRPV